MKKSDRLHALVDKLYRLALADTDYTYQPRVLRIDYGGWHLLLRSEAAFTDRSFDRFEHPDKFKWRGLERVAIYAAATDLKFEDEEPPEGAEIVCTSLCIESRQAGEHGRRKYYDATETELEAVNE